MTEIKFGRLLKPGLSVCELFASAPGLAASEQVSLPWAGGAGPAALALPLPDTEGIHWR